jgi:hypothetical protein
MVAVGWDDEWREVGGTRQLPVHFWLESAARPDEPGWRVDFEVLDGQPRCRRVIVQADAGGREVRSVHLRALLLEDLLEGAATNVARQPAVGEDGETQWVRTSLRDWRDVVKDVKRSRGRPRISEQELGDVADVYRANLDEKPTQAVADHFEVAPRTARLYVQRARERGLL